MTIKEMNKILSETINALHNSDANKGTHGAIIARADAEAAVAKQYFKGVEIILRADKISGRTDRIDEVIG